MTTQSPATETRPYTPAEATPVRPGTLDLPPLDKLPIIDPDDLPHTVEIYGSAPVCCATLQRAEWMGCEDGLVLDATEWTIPPGAARSIVAAEGSSDGVQGVCVGEIRRATAEEIEAMRAEGRG